jgi:hypothetical protein
MTSEESEDTLSQDFGEFIGAVRPRCDHPKGPSQLAKIVARIVLSDIVARRPTDKGDDEDK